VLSVLVTHPEKQGLGVGSTMVKWGCDLADEEGLPSYLEATPAGYPVYQKLGFEEVDAIIFKFKPFTGKEGSVKITNMIRPAKKL
jgi:GNAT superfamily N-acetyltransferase